MSSLLLIGAPPASAALTATPDATYVTDGSVYAIARSASTIYLGGLFHHVGPRTGAAVPIDASTGHVTAGFPEVSGGAGTVNAILADGSGGWYLGGDFTHVGGLSRRSLAHVLGDGTVDTSFHPDPKGVVNALALGNGTLYVGGEFTTIGSQPRTNLAAVDTSTGSTSAWAPNPDGKVYTVAFHGSANAFVHPTLYIGGEFATIGTNSASRNRIAEVDTVDGTATAWNPDSDQPVHATVIRNASGATPLAIFVGGDFTLIGGHNRSGLAELDSRGNATAWAPEPTAVGAYVHALALTGGTLWVGGAFAQIGTNMVGRANVAAVDTTTGAATSWDGGTVNPVETIAVSGPTVYVGGQIASLCRLDDCTATNASRGFLGAFDALTGDVTSWDPEASGPVNALALSGSTVYAGGAFSAVGMQPRQTLAAIDAGTGRPTSWNPGTDGLVTALAASSSAVYVGGGFTHVGGQTRHELAAVDTAGHVLSGWDPDPAGQISAVVLSGSRLYISGAFNKVSGQTRNALAAIDASTGTLVSDWHPSAGGNVWALALSGSTLYIGGDFMSIDAQFRYRLAAVDAATGVLQFGWIPYVSDTVRALAVSGSTVYVGGDFIAAGGSIAIHHLAAFDTAGNLIAGWNPDPDASVGALAVTGQTLYAGGDFTHVVGVEYDHLAAIGADGQPTSWNPGPNDQVRALLATSDGTVYAGGDFSSMELAGQAGFASFSEPPTNVSAPSISGLHVGHSATCSTGSWGGSTPFRFGYAWLRDGIALAGATAATYTPATGDAGHKLSCRVMATNLRGSGVATSGSLTVPSAPSATTGSATALGPTGATLSGLVNPHGDATAISFEYGTTSAYGASTAAGAAGSGTTAKSVSAALRNLKPATTYHFRLAATSLCGTAHGADATFRTLRSRIVPKLVGKSLAKSRRALRRAHCRLGKVGHAYSRQVGKGRVVSQRPKPRKILRAKSKVRVVLSLGRKG